MDPSFNALTTIGRWYLCGTLSGLKWLAKFRKGTGVNYRARDGNDHAPQNTHTPSIVICHQTVRVLFNRFSPATLAPCYRYCTPYVHKLSVCIKWFDRCWWDFHCAVLKRAEQKRGEICSSAEVVIDVGN